jgi:hypothetical protein
VSAHQPEFVTPKADLNFRKLIDELNILPHQGQPDG